MAWPGKVRQGLLILYVAGGSWYGMEQSGEHWRVQVKINIVRHSRY